MMHPFSGQDLAAAGIAALALGWLVWSRLRARRRKTPFCADCPACQAGEAAAPRTAPVKFTDAPPR